MSPPCNPAFSQNKAPHHEAEPPLIPTPSAEPEILPVRHYKDMPTQSIQRNLSLLQGDTSHWYVQNILHCRTCRESPQREDTFFHLQIDIRTEHRYPNILADLLRFVLLVQPQSPPAFS